MVALIEFFPALIEFQVILSHVSTHLLFLQIADDVLSRVSGAFIRSILIMSCFSQYSFVGFESSEILLSLLYLFCPFD